MNHKLPFPELERIYDELAQAIDQCGIENESELLCKIILCLANEHCDGNRVSQIIAECLNEGSITTSERIKTMRLI